MREANKRLKESLKGMKIQQNVREEKEEELILEKKQVESPRADSISEVLLGN